METFLSHNPQAENDAKTKEEVIEAEQEGEYWTNQDPWQHMSSVVCNLCQCATGRDFVVKNYLRRIAAQVITFIYSIHAFTCMHSLR